MSQRGCKIMKLYKELSQIPNLTDARILNNGRAVTSIWSQRNIERGKIIKFSRTFLLAPDLTKQSDVPSLDISNELLISMSPSELHRAVIRRVEETGGPKHFFEIWSQGHLRTSIDLAALELHGDVYTDDDFGVLQWSPDEKKIIYIAEKKEPKTEPFYKKKVSNAESKDSETSKGEQFLYKETWGEQLATRKESVIIIHDVINENFSILEGIPEGLFPMQVVWAPDSSYIAGVVLITKPRKLGYIYHTNRSSLIFTLDLNKNYKHISLKGKAVRCPRFTPDGDSLVWLERESDGPHGGCLTLVKKELSAPQEHIITIVPIVKKELKITGDAIFYGLYNAFIPKRCWLSDSRLVLSTPQQNQINSYVIDIKTNRITEMPSSKGSQIVLDVYNNLIVVNQTNFLKSSKLGIGIVPPSGQENSLVIDDITDSKQMEHSESFTFTYMDLKHNTNEDVDNFTAIYIGPKSGENKNIPLVVWPHGGPHSSFVNNLMLENCLYNACGFAVLLVNYRGSTGTGEDSIKYLLGKIGSVDVSDCVLATKVALENYPWLDPNQMAIVGGSHGGFLVAHLIGQYPHMFKVAVARNPVINLPALAVTSDIPDWTYLETGFQFSQHGAPQEEALKVMRSVSPIQYAHQVTTPLLLQVGSKDLRVPSSQSIEYYHTLRANEKTVRMNLYKDNHPIMAVHNEVDNIINSILWIQDHIS
ncbi:hypothetical protein FQA39_LY07955 [Lamprigera yunnana]|nr:hypothetical protein FQA39_LY07955 [Lamprigera yunnana]